MKSEFQGLIGSNQPGGKSGRSLKETVMMYLYYWPLFVVSVMLALAAGYVYLRYQVSLYSANTIINVRGETTTNKNVQGGGDLISNAMNGGRSAINLDNELGRLRSARLMSLVVRGSDLNISYYRVGRFNEVDVYHDAPFRLIPKDLQDSSGSLALNISKLSGGGFTLSYGPEDNLQKQEVAWNQNFTIRGNTYMLTPQSTQWNGADRYKIVWNPAMITVYELLPKVTANVLGKTNNIVLNTTIENAKRGEDLLNQMVQVFIQMNLDDQNRNAQDKIYFIEDRLSKISDELKGVEKTEAGYAGQNLMVGGSASTLGIPIGQAQIEIDRIATQKSTLSMIRSALAGGEGKTLPTAGVTDGTLGGLIGSYNQALLKKQGLAGQVAPGSLILKDLDDQIRTLRSGIADNLNNNIRALDLQASNYSRQGSLFRSSVSALPDKQRVLGEISREKNIKENLYVYLLQKREETALSKSTVSPYEQIDLATSYGPVSPNHKSIYIYAALIGLALPVGIILLIGLLNDKIKSRDEVENGVKAQLVGEINHIKRSDEKYLPALKGGIVGEQFRIIRANLNFLQKGAGQQTILVTSSGSGEGKSFVSLNLSAVLARTGKRVALLDFDLRKPDDSLPSSLSGKGLKDYLLGEASLEEMRQSVGEIPSLHLYPSGQVVADVGDLIVSDRADELFEELKGLYDVVVVNTPPVGLVGDALILQKYSTVIGYVIREGYTKKKQIGYLNSLIESGKFNNACVIYNGVRTGMKYGYYGYGYTKNNAYFETRGTNRITNVFKRKKAKALS
jgi:capsular exopolysaccharide synthesis family protein